MATTAKSTLIEVDIKGPHVGGQSPAIKHKLEHDAVRLISIPTVL